MTTQERPCKWKHADPRMFQAECHVCYNTVTKPEYGALYGENFGSGAARQPKMSPTAPARKKCCDKKGLCKYRGRALRDERDKVRTRLVKTGVG